MVFVEHPVAWDSSRPKCCFLSTTCILRTAYPAPPLGVCNASSMFGAALTSPRAMINLPHTLRDNIQFFLTSFYPPQVVGAAPPCGDGACEPPFEFPAFGRFGCKADCGTFTNVTPIVYSIDTNFPDEGARSAASWNLCMTSPIVLCWCVMRRNASPLHACNSSLSRISRNLLKRRI